MKKITATVTYEVEFECENWDSLNCFEKDDLARQEVTDDIDIQSEQTFNYESG